MYNVHGKQHHFLLGQDGDEMVQQVLLDVPDLREHRQQQLQRLLQTRHSGTSFPTTVRGRKVIPVDI